MTSTLDNPPAAGLPARLETAWIRSLQRPSALAMLVMVVAIVFRLHGLHHDLLGDHVAYAQYAYQMVEGTFTLRDNYPYVHRLPVVALQATSYLAFGVSPYSTLVVPLLLSLVQIVMVMWVGTRVFGPATGLLAGLFMALLPLDVNYSGIPGADGVLSTFMTLAAGFWLLGLESVPRPRRAFLFLSGICFALAALTRMYSVIFGVFYLVYVLWRRPPLRAVAWTLHGVLAVAIPVLFLYWEETGHALYPLLIQAETFGQRIQPQRFDFLHYPRNLYRPTGPAGPFGDLFMLAGVIGLFRWDRRRALLYLWFLPLLLFLAYGSMSLTSYRPVYKEVRYLTPLCAPLALLTASLAMEWLSSRRSRKADGGLQRGGRPLRGWLLALFLVGLAGFSWWVAGRIRERHDRNSASFESAARLLGRDRSVPIYFDHWRTALAMSYYFRFKEGAEVYRDAEDSLRIGPPGTFRGSRFGYLAWYQDPDSVPPGYIVIDRELLALAARAGSPPARYLGVVVPGFCFAPPGTWEPASGFGRITVYRNRGPGTRGGAAPAEFPVTGMGPGGSPEPRGGP